MRSALTSSLVRCKLRAASRRIGGCGRPRSEPPAFSIGQGRAGAPRHPRSGFFPKAGPGELARGIRGLARGLDNRPSVSGVDMNSPPSRPPIRADGLGPKGTNPPFCPRWSMRFPLKEKCPCIDTDSSQTGSPVWAGWGEAGLKAPTGSLLDGLAKPKENQLDGFKLLIKFNACGCKVLRSKPPTGISPK